MDAVEEIKGRLGIEDVISEYVELKRSGRNFKGLSPFGNERTPSFMVSPEKQIWHDFSSGKGGDMFSFIMEVEGVDFKGALELLARKAGVDLDQFRGKGAGDGKRKERMQEAVELAARFYQVQFSKNPVAYEYVFKKRKFTKEMALMFRLGYAPDNFDSLTAFMRKKGFKDNELKAAGLSTMRRGGFSDMFRGRLMIPLMDAQGGVIGFTARLLVDDPDAPKYINTPQSLLYDKSRHVYGLHLAKDTIRKNGFAVVVEGNLDVIASHQAGVRQVVATAGTAMTEQHFKAISRFAGDIRMCFDADKAGQNATERTIPVASKVGVSLSVITIPSGKDPDELVKEDPELWLKIINEQQYAFDWLINRYAAQVDLASAPGKLQFSDVLLPLVRQLKDDVERDHYLNRIAELSLISKEALAAKMQGFTGRKTTARKAVAQSAKQLPINVEQIKLENHLLALALVRPTLRADLDPVAEEMLQQPQAKQFRRFLQGHPEFDGNATIVTELEPLADYVKILLLLYEELYQGLEFQELQYEATRLQVRLIEHYVKTKKSELAAQLRETMTPTGENDYLQQVRRLDELLHTIQNRRT